MKYRCPKCKCTFEGKLSRCPKCNAVFEYRETKYIPTSIADDTEVDVPAPARWGIPFTVIALILSIIYLVLTPLVFIPASNYAIARAFLVSSIMTFILGVVGIIGSPSVGRGVAALIMSSITLVVSAVLLLTTVYVG